MCSLRHSVSTSSLISRTTTQSLLAAVMLRTLTIVKRFLSPWRQTWTNTSERRCDHNPVHLSLWRSYFSFLASLWPKVSGDDGLTGWAWCSAMTKGHWSLWVDWVSLMLCCDQRSVELMGWLGELDAALWPKVRVDWMSLMLRCDQRSVELMGWLGELDAPLWPKVSGADGLTGWAWCSAMTNGQWSWWVDWVSLMLRCEQILNIWLGLTWCRCPSTFTYIVHFLSGWV